MENEYTYWTENYYADYVCYSCGYEVPVKVNPDGWYYCPICGRKIISQESYEDKLKNG